MKMDKNIAIEFNNVGKQYRLGRVGTGTLSHDLNRWWQTSILGKEDPYLKIGEVNDRSTKGHSDYVWALKDINFKVEMGDVVGIIGKNGAGKSTLLKLLSHITAPSTGDIRYRGRIASLLEVGTGFHPEMTARENIYMNGSIMGMTRHEITRKLDEIVDFAGIERYLDTPVKRFSSGMTVRLGFAVAAFLEPEILVVDEVLAVGDAEFQKKAIGKMKDVSSSGGRTVLFVSHNMDSMLQLCDNGILLENGQMVFSGKIDDTVSRYLSGNKDNFVYKNSTSKHNFYISEASLCGNENNRKGVFAFDDKIALNVDVSKKENCLVDKNLVISVCVVSSRGTRICTNEIPINELSNSKELSIQLEYPSSLFAPGSYFFRADIHIPNVSLFDGQDICNFHIHDTGSHLTKYNNPNNGFILINPTVQIKQI